jgi:hypothetical protein
MNRLGGIRVCGAIFGTKRRAGAGEWGNPAGAQSELLLTERGIAPDGPRSRFQSLYPQSAPIYARGWFEAVLRNPESLSEGGNP